MHDPDGPPKDLPSVAERRRAERHPCSLPLHWRVLDSEEGGSETVGVCDISTTGIGLLLSRPVRTGDVLVLQLQGPDRQLTRPMPVRVMHVTQRAPGEWRVVGCFIRPLTQRELQALRDEA